MKKLFFFAAALLAAVTVSAQDKVVKEISEYCNYIEFQALSVSNPDVVATAPKGEDVVVTLPNGTKLKSYIKSDGTVVETAWDVKTGYSVRAALAPDRNGVVNGLQGVDTLRVGTNWKAASNCTMELGGFTTNAAGKIKVFYKVDSDESKKTGTDVRGIGISLGGGALEEYRLASPKGNICVAAFDIPQGQYMAGDVSFKVLKNTLSICGIQIENLSGTANEDVEAEGAKAVKKMVDGQLVIEKGGKLYNALGAEL